jgi:hypothetical protein
VYNKCSIMCGLNVTVTQHVGVKRHKCLNWQREDLQTNSQHIYYILFLVFFSDMNFTKHVLIHGCWNIEPVLCVKWIYLNIMDLLLVVHMQFITSMHIWFYFLVAHFSHSEGCYGRGERSVLFNDAVSF